MGISACAGRYRGGGRQFEDIDAWIDVRPALRLRGSQPFFSSPVGLWPGNGDRATGIK